MPSQRPIIGYLAELERQAWDDEGREKDRQKALSGASEGDGLAPGGLEGPSSAGVSATADSQGVTSGFDWYLDRVVHLDRTLSAAGFAVPGAAGWIVALVGVLAWQVTNLWMGAPTR